MPAVGRVSSLLTYLLVFCLVASALSDPVAAAKIKSRAGIPVEVKQSGYCSALAPADWTITSAPQGSAVDLFSADQSIHVFWGGAAINRAMEPYYGSFYGSPESSMRTMVRTMLHGYGDYSEPEMTSGPKPFLHYFDLVYFKTEKANGLVFYKIYPTGWPQYYVESVYIALAKKSVWTKKKGLAAGVVVSIRCATQLIPEPTAQVQTKGGQPQRAGCGGGGNLRGYNKELGTQYAHSPTTGQNFLLDPATDWHETGSDGPGYYRQAGNSYEKLDLGRDDDC